MEINVMENILEKNDEIASALKELFTQKGIFVINLLGSPGCGKTSLVEQTVKMLSDEFSLAIIEGDLYTSKDADRIAAHGVPVIQINTHGGCHLDAVMVKTATEQLDLNKIDILIVENVGNLVCPAEFSVGEHAKVVILSVAEGEDKPLKYPLVFQQSAAIIINKVDLLPYTDFALESATQDILGINPQAALMQVSCRNGYGLTIWLEWLRQQVLSLRNKE